MHHRGLVHRPVPSTPGWRQRLSVLPGRAALPASLAALAVLAAVVLSGCGGASTDDPGTPAAALRSGALAGASGAADAAAPPAEAPIAVFAGRGELRAVERLRRFQVAELAAAVAVPGVRVGGVTPRFDVEAWRVSYVTVDGANRPIVASGLVAYPVKAAGRLSPVLSYQHGTIFYDAEAPSNAMRADEPPMVIASLGYTVVAADYVGYGVSRQAQHPYLLAAPTAAAVHDLLTAARLWRQRADYPGPRGNGQLFLGGYSEGGYATAAAHREIQSGAGPHRAQLVMSIAGGGPQDVGMTLDRQLARVKDENRLIGGLINPGFLRHLGSTLREEVRRQMLRLIIPDGSDVSFQTTFLDFFLADDVGSINQHCNVLDWAPQVPYMLFHGRDDRTVTFLSSENARAYAIAAGAPAGRVPLLECDASPSDHLPCVPKFFQLATGMLGSVARDLD